MATTASRRLPIGQYTVTRNGAARRNSHGQRRHRCQRRLRRPPPPAARRNSTAVEVVGTGAINPIDVSSVESTTILTAEQIAKIPVPRDTTSVALLAPGTVRGDAVFGNLASFGGASVAENAYFVNGFNITNSFRNLNFVAGAVRGDRGTADQDRRLRRRIRSFARRRGQPDHQARYQRVPRGRQHLLEPGRACAKTCRTLYQPTGDARASDNSQDDVESWRANVWASGALIKDRLFAYGLMSYGRTETDNLRATSLRRPTPATTSSTPTWLVKMDWNITDSHILEFTAFSDKQETETDVYANARRRAVERWQPTSARNFSEPGRRQLRPEVHRLPDRHVHPVGAVSATASSRASQHLRHGRSGLPTCATTATSASTGARGCPVIVDAARLPPATSPASTRSTCNITSGTIDRDRLGRHARPVPHRRRMAARRPPAALRLRHRRLRVGRRRGRSKAARCGATDRRSDGIADSGDESTSCASRSSSQGATVEVEQQRVLHRGQLEHHRQLHRLPRRALGYASRTSTARARPTSRSTTSSARAWASRGTCSATRRSRCSVTPAATRCR